MGEYWNETKSEANLTGLVLPNVSVDDYLKTRLMRNGKALIFDAGALLGGVRDAEVENRSTVMIMGKPRGDDSAEFELSKAASSMDWYKAPKDLVELTIDATPTDEEGSQYLANVGFWSAVLISEIIGDDKMRADKLDSIVDKLRKKSMAQTVGSLSVALSGVAGRFGMMVAGYGIPVVPSVVLLASQLGSQVGLNTLSNKNKKVAKAVKLGDQEAQFQAIQSEVYEVACMLTEKYRPLVYVDAVTQEERQRSLAVGYIARKHAAADVELM